MTGTHEPGDGRPVTDEGPAAMNPTAEGAIWAEGAADMGTETAELIAEIRQLAAHDPAGVQQVVADVLSALDRVAGGALRDQLPDGAVLGGGEPPVQVGDAGAPATEQRTAEIG